MDRVLFLGDFFYDYDRIEKDIYNISKWIRDNRYNVILNLEGPLSDQGMKINKRGPNLVQAPIAIDVLKKLNVIGVCLANNHMLDFGENALKETIEILDRHDILHTGAGMNLEHAMKPMMFKLNNSELIVLNYGWDIEETVYATESSAGCAPRSNELILENVKKYKGTHEDATIVNVFHWGFEYNLYPMPFDIDLAHKVIDAGSDLIIGHHSHNIQPYETYKDKYIFYSLGNFYFGSRRKKFKNKVFRSAVKNMCDYGAAVSLNLSSGQVNKFLFEYNHICETSNICTDDKMLENIMLDFTGECYFDKEYEAKAKANSLNITPILTRNQFRNTFKLLKLKCYYTVVKILKLVPGIHFIRQAFMTDKK